MKIVCLVLLIAALASYTVGAQSNSSLQDTEAESFDNDFPNDESTNENLNVQTNINVDGKNVVLIAVQEMGEFTLNGKNIEIVVFETYPKIDFIKIFAGDHFLGVQAEYAWINYRYSGFLRTEQALVEFEINGNILPFDILKIENNETKEIRYLYFDLSDFFGKW